MDLSFISTSLSVLELKATVTAVEEPRHLFGTSRLD